MSEHKSDDFLSTGTHHAWAGEAASSVIRAGGAARLVGSRAADEFAPCGDHALALQLVELQELDGQGSQQLGQGEEVIRDA
jgi:hypothetical protein